MKYIFVTLYLAEITDPQLFNGSIYRWHIYMPTFEFFFNLNCLIYLFSISLYPPLSKKWLKYMYFFNTFH